MQHPINPSETLKPRHPGPKPKTEKNSKVAAQRTPSVASWLHYCPQHMQTSDRLSRAPFHAADGFPLENQRQNHMENYMETVVICRASLAWLTVSQGLLMPVSSLRNSSFFGFLVNIFAHRNHWQEGRTQLATTPRFRHASPPPALVPSHHLHEPVTG